MATETELDRMVIRLLGDAKSYDTMLKDAQQTTRIVGKTIEQETDKVTMFGQELSKLGSDMGGAFAGSQAAWSALSAPLDFLKEGVQIAAAAESMEIAFGTMLKSADKGKKMVADLQEFAAKTPLTMPGIQQATKTLLQFGIEGEDVIETLRQLGDVSSGVEANVQRMVLGFGQMVAKGKVSMEELNQMREAGFNPLQEIARTSGKSVAEVSADLEKGKVGIEDIKNALKSATSEGGNFFNGMEKSSQGLEGLLSTMGDNLNAVKKTFGEVIIEGFHLKEMVKLVAEGADAFVQAFKSIPSEIKIVTVSVVTLTGVVLVLTKAWKIGAIAVGIVAKTWTDVGGTVRWLINGVRSLAATTVAANVAIGTSATVIQGTFVGGLKVAMTSLLSFSKSLLLNPITLWVAGIAAAVVALKKLYHELTGVQDKVDEYNKALGRSKAVDTKERIKGTEKVRENLAAAHAIPEQGMMFKALEAENLRVQNEIGKAEANVEKYRELIKEVEGKKHNKFLIGEEKRMQNREFDSEIAYFEDQIESLGKKLESLREDAALTREAVDKARSANPDDLALKAMRDYGDQLKEQLVTLGKTGAAAEKAKLQMKFPKLTDKYFEDLFELVDRIERGKLAEDAEKLAESWRHEAEALRLGAEAAKIKALADKGLDRDAQEDLMWIADQKQWAEDAKKLKDEVEKANKEFASPEQKFADRMAELDKMKAAGLGVEQYANAVKEAEKDLQNATKAAEKANQAFDAVAAGSVEARARMDEYFGGLRGPLEQGKPRFADPMAGFQFPEEMAEAANHIEVAAGKMAQAGPRFKDLMDLSRYGDRTPMALKRADEEKMDLSKYGDREPIDLAKWKQGSKEALAETEKLLKLLIESVRLQTATKEGDTVVLAEAGF